MTLGYHYIIGDREIISTVPIDFDLNEPHRQNYAEKGARHVPGKKRGHRFKKRKWGSVKAELSKKEVKA